MNFHFFKIILDSFPFINLLILEICFKKIMITIINIVKNKLSWLWNIINRTTDEANRAEREEYLLIIATINQVKIKINP